MLRKFAAVVRGELVKWLLLKARDLTLSEFQSFVAARPQNFAGVHPHTDAEFARFESQLGHALPDALRWLLGVHGYSQGSGVDNLAEAVDQTTACRSSISLPHNWLLLNDWGDSGVVLLDLPTGRVCWCGAHNVANLAGGTIDSDADWYDGYPEWAASRIEDAD
jgi:hypothetical protein